MAENHELWRMNAYYVSTPSEIMEQVHINMKQLADKLDLTETNLRKKIDRNNNILLQSLAEVYSALDHTLLIFPLPNDVFNKDDMERLSRRYGNFREIQPHNLPYVFSNSLLANISGKSQVDHCSAALILSLDSIVKCALDNGLQTEVAQAIDCFTKTLTNAITAKQQHCIQIEEDYG